MAQCAQGIYVSSYKLSEMCTRQQTATASWKDTTLKKGKGHQGA